MNAIIKSFHRGVVSCFSECVRTEIESSNPPSKITQVKVGKYLGVTQSAVSRQISSTNSNPFTYQHAILYPVFYGFQTIPIPRMSKSLLSFAVNHVIHDKKLHGFNEDGSRPTDPNSVGVSSIGVLLKKGLTSKELDQKKASNAQHVTRLVSLYNLNLLRNKSSVEQLLASSALVRNNKGEESDFDLRSFFPDATEAQLLAHSAVGIETLAVMSQLLAYELFIDLMNVKEEIDD